MRKLNVRRPNATTAIAITALVFSATGTSYAAATIAKNTVRSSSIANGQVKTSDLGLFAVTTPKLADGSVTTPKLGDGSVTNPKLGDGSVTNPKLGDGSVTNPKLADGSVTTPKLADGAVTTPKLADRSVTRGKIASGALPAFAVVAGSNGVLNRSSSDVVGSARSAVGTYTVVLDRDVTQCAYIAGLGGIDTNVYAADGVSAAQEGTDPNKVKVLVTTPAGAPIDHSFHLTVVC